MKIFSLVVIVMLSAGMSIKAYGQVDSTHLETGRKLKLLGYVAGVYEHSSVSPIHTNSLGIQAAVLINNHWQIGFYGTKYSNDKYREQLIFPNFFQMNYKQAGLLIGYRTPLGKKYEFNIESKLGSGEVKWDELDTGNPFLADRFRMINFQISGDYLLTSFMVLNGYAGYRRMADLEITGLDNADFNGIYYGIVVKLGIFR